MPIRENEYYKVTILNPTLMENYYGSGVAVSDDCYFAGHVDDDNTAFVGVLLIEKKAYSCQDTFLFDEIELDYEITEDEFYSILAECHDTFKPIHGIRIPAGSGTIPISITRTGSGTISTTTTVPWDPSWTISTGTSIGVPLGGYTTTTGTNILPGTYIYTGSTTGSTTASTAPPGSIYVRTDSGWNDANTFIYNDGNGNKSYSETVTPLTAIKTLNEISEIIGIDPALYSNNEAYQKICSAVKKLAEESNEKPFQLLCQTKLNKKN